MISHAHDDQQQPPQATESGGIPAAIERIRAFFAPPPASPPLPRHIVERNARRCEAATALLEHLRQPDGVLKLSGLHIGKIARALKIKFKWIVKALRDLVESGAVDGYIPPVYVVVKQNGNHTGNRCGHDPRKPRWFTAPPWHKQHPKIIDRIIAKVRDYYDDPRGTLPGLNFAHPFRNEKKRQRRSERREACCAMLGAILQFCDLVTLRVGRPTESGTAIVGIPMVELAELAGLARINADGTVCIRRAERAVADLKAAGIVTVHEICEKLDNVTYKGLAAIRAVSKFLFEAFGLGQWLAHERRKAKERYEKKLKKKQYANMRMRLDGQEETKPKLPENRRTGEMRSAAEMAVGLKALEQIKEDLRRMNEKAEQEARARRARFEPPPDTS